MLIGELAAQVDVNIETVRYYEWHGLLNSRARLASGYRAYDADAVRRVSFIRRAQAVCFTLYVIEDILPLWNDSAESSLAVGERAHCTRANRCEASRSEQNTPGARPVRSCLSISSLPRSLPVVAGARRVGAPSP